MVVWYFCALVIGYTYMYSHIKLCLQVILSMGEMLYIPGNWFHYIVSQDASIQCNSRSGMSNVPSSSLGDCGHL